MSGDPAIYHNSSSILCDRYRSSIYQFYSMCKLLNWHERRSSFQESIEIDVHRFISLATLISGWLIILLCVLPTSSSHLTHICGNNSTNSRNKLCKHRIERWTRSCYPQPIRCHRLVELVQMYVCLSLTQLLKQWNTFQSEDKRNVCVQISNGSFCVLDFKRYAHIRTWA